MSIQLQPLDFELVRDEYPDRWERADAAEASVKTDVDPGRFRVHLPGGDLHDAVFVRRGEEFLGHCDCDGFSFHTTGGDGPCAHLCTLGKFTVMDEIEAPPVDAVEADGVTLDNLEDGSREIETDGDGDVEASANSGQPDESEIVVPNRDPREIETAQEFVEEIAGVPKAFVIQMGHGKDKKPYVTKEGLNYVAFRQGLQTRAEPLSPSWEEPHDMAAWRGIVRDQEGREWTDVGTAWVDHEDMKGAESNLDELASTRATNRALRLATGAGLASIEEIEGRSVAQEAEADNDADDVVVVDAEGELTTDGGARQTAWPQVTVRMPERWIDKLDARVDRGAFENRSAAIREGVSRVLQVAKADGGTVREELPSCLNCGDPIPPEVLDVDDEFCSIGCIEEHTEAIVEAYQSFYGADGLTVAKAVAVVTIGHAIDAIERVDWRHVEGMTPTEGAALTQRLIEARDATKAEEVADAK